MQVDTLIAKVRELASASPDFVYHEALVKVPEDREVVPGPYIREFEDEYYQMDFDGECKYSPSVWYDETNDRLVNQPGCIMGQALSALEPEWDSSRWDSGGGTSVATVLIDDEVLGIPRSEIWDTEPTAAMPRHTTKGRWLMHVQGEQDMGKSWAEAIKSADNQFPLKQEGEEA
jgi:hypothetical protein